MDTRVIEAVIETLQCAEINCDNVKKLGASFVDVPKMQISDAIKTLEEWLESLPAAKEGK